VTGERAEAATIWTAGDRVYRYWDTVAFGVSMQPLTVVRVNRVSVTVRTDQGSTFRMNPADIAGRYEWGTEDV
jgi:inosine-uridine nucleoside N-ribohydrolase